MRLNFNHDRKPTVLFVIWTLLCLINSSMSARTCKKNLDLSLVSKIEEFEKQDHPECLMELVIKFQKQNFPSLKKWRTANNQMKLVKRQPKTWSDFYQLLSLLSSSDAKDIDHALTHLEDLSLNDKNELQGWLSSQKSLSKELSSLKTIPIIKKELEQLFPFLRL